MARAEGASCLTANQGRAATRGLELGSLEFLWMLDVGIWSFDFRVFSESGALALNSVSALGG